MRIELSIETQAQRKSTSGATARLPHTACPVGARFARPNRQAAGRLDRLRTASVDDWWTVSAERVDEYVDRVERSIGRLNNDKQ
jgi:hypothetical protein